MRTPSSSLGFLPASYNPLDMLDRNDPNAVAIAKAISSAICPSAEGKGKDSFWTATPARLLTAILLWITYESREIKTLARARAIASLSRKDFTEKYLTKMAGCSAFSGAIRDNASTLYRPRRGHVFGPDCKLGDVHRVCVRSTGASRDRQFLFFDERSDRRRHGPADHGLFRDG